MKYDLFNFEYNEIVKYGYSLPSIKAQIDYFYFCIKELRNAIFENETTTEERNKAFLQAMNYEDLDVTFEETFNLPLAQINIKDNKIKSYQLSIKKLQQEIDYVKMKSQIFEDNGSRNSNFKLNGPIDSNSTKINLKKEVIAFAKTWIKKNQIGLSDPYFVSKVRNKLLAELNKRSEVKLTAKNKESIRTYLSNLKKELTKETNRDKGKEK